MILSDCNLQQVRPVKFAVELHSTVYEVLVFFAVLFIVTDIKSDAC